MKKTELEKEIQRMKITTIYMLQGVRCNLETKMIKARHFNSDVDARDKKPRTMDTKRSKATARHWRGPCQQLGKQSKLEVKGWGHRG